MERELVRRYGAWIIAVPKDGDPRSALSTALALALAGAAIGLTLLGLRLVRRDRAASLRLDSPVPRASGSARDQQLDASLEAELRRMDD